MLQLLRSIVALDGAVTRSRIGSIGQLGQSETKRHPIENWHLGKRIPIVTFVDMAGFLPGTAREGQRISLAIVSFLPFALLKALRNRRSPRYQRGLVREALCEIGVILLHNVERCFLGEPAMVLGK